MGIAEGGRASRPVSELSDRELSEATYSVNAAMLKELQKLTKALTDSGIDKVKLPSWLTKR